MMLELTTPKVRVDSRVAGEFRPRKLESWLASLPRTDRETYSKLLRRALSAQNRVVIPPTLRLELMDLYMVPFQEIQGSLQAELRTIATIPLHPHYRSKQASMLELLDALATGYKIAAVDLSEQRRGHNRQLELALALQRAVYCLGQIILTASEIYLRPPGDTWRELHGLYRCAEQEGLEEREVPPAGEQDGPWTVLDSYLQILLVGASEPQGLLPGEVRRLYDLAPQWCGSMKITSAAELPTQPGHFRINLKSDAPPLPLSKTAKPAEDPKEANIRVLRTLGVARNMHEVLTSMNEPATRSVMERVFIAGIDAADAELFRRAGRVLGEVSITRGSTRFSPDRELDFASGFGAVLVACNGGRPFDLPLPVAQASQPARESRPPEEEGTKAWVDDSPGAAMTEPAAGPGEESVEVPEHGPGEELFIDLAEPMLDLPAARERAEGRGSPAAAGLDRANVRVYADNQGAGGVCLVAARSPQLRIKVGDIGACRLEETSGWQLGTVRWMRVGSKEVRFGVQFMGPVAIPVAVAAQQEGTELEGEGPVIAAIWLPENPLLKKPSSIVLPRRAEPYPAVLGVVGADGVPTAVRLLKRVERTGDYEQFLVSLEVSGSESQSILSS